MTLKRLWLAKLLLLGGTSLVCLLVAEIFVRVMLPVSPVYAVDENCIYKLVPDSTEVYLHTRSNGGGRVYVRVNSRGFRGDELARAGSMKRVVIYGDSFIEAAYTPLEETYSAALARDLRDAYREPVEVVNAGVTGYGPDQISLRLDAEVDALKPDLVVVAICTGNDFGDLVRDKLFRLDADGRLVKNRFAIAEDVRVQLGRRPRLQLPHAARNAYAEIRSRFSPAPDAAGYPPHYVEYALKTSRDEYESYVLAGDNVVRNLFDDHYDADIALQPDAASSRYKIKLMEQVILRIKQSLDSRRVPFVLLIIPQVIDASPNFEIQVDAETYKQYDRAALTNAIREIAARNRITYLNLYDDFRSADATKFYLRYPESHWNADGQSFAAALTSRLIVSDKLLGDIAPQTENRAATLIVAAQGIRR
jgi:lysophospholipase L1-like esterase